MFHLISDLGDGIDLSTFDTFFSSWSTSKRLWNANMPYGGRYVKYFATSL